MASKPGLGLFALLFWDWAQGGQNPQKMFQSMCDLKTLCILGLRKQAATMAKRAGCPKMKLQCRN
jgi:hypothetical protein